MKFSEVFFQTSSKKKTKTLFTYSQEENRRQRQKRQHGFWLLQELPKDRCHRPDRGRFEEESRLWRECEWKEKEKERCVERERDRERERERERTGVLDARTEGSTTTTQNPLSLSLYPTTPLAPAWTQPIPPRHTPPTPAVTSLRFFPH